MSESEYEESESEFDGPEEYRDDDPDKQPVYPRGTPMHMQKRWWTDYTNEEGEKVGKWMSDHDLKKKRRLERELLQLTKKPQSITRVNKRKHDYLMKEVVDINKQAKAW